MKPQLSIAATLMGALLLTACGGGPGLFSGTAPAGTTGGTGSTGTTGGATSTPTITAVSPAQVNAGAIRQTLTLTGTQFQDGATVTFNNDPETVQLVTATTITVAIADADLAAGGTLPLVVTNPDGGTVTVKYPVINPPPVLSSLSPGSAVAGAAPLTLTLTGTGFNPSTTVAFNGSNHLVTYLGATQVSIVLNAGELATALVVPVVVSNPAPGGGPSAAVNFLIANPLPAIIGFNPAAIDSGSAAQTLTVNGTGFVSGSVVTWNGANRTTTFISPTQITAALTAADLATGGSVSVGVTNPSPGGGNSATAAFAVTNPVPTVTAVAPAYMVLGEDQAVTLTGTNFTAGATVNFANGSGNVSLTPTAISSTQITVTIPGAQAQSAGSAYTLGVANPTPGGGASNTVAFAVNYPLPVLSSMLPVSAPVNATIPVTVTLGGTGFNSDTTVSFAAATHAATTLNSTQISLTLSGADLTQSGIFPVTVSNPSAPAPGGGASNALYFSVGAPTASPAGIAVVSEKVSQPGGGPQTLDVAYLPMPPTPGGSQSEIDVVQLDTIDVPPFLPINGFVTNASPSFTPGIAYGSFMNKPNTSNHTAVLKRITVPAGYTPNFTVADTADNLVLVGSADSSEILTISTSADPSVQAISNTYTLSGISGSVAFSDYLCSGVCDLGIDQSGVSGRAGAWAMTPSGLIRFTASSGASLTPAVSGITPGPEFGYSSTNSAWNLLNPFYQQDGTAGLQLLNLMGTPTLTNLTNPVGTRPTSAVIDPGSQLALVADEGTGEDFLMNLFSPPTTATATVPTTSFFLGSGGTNCETRPDWTMTALDASSHLLLSAQMFAGCLAVTQMPAGPVTSGGAAATPTVPAATHFGPITAPQAPYMAAAPWGQITTWLDPDGIKWGNGGDPYRFAIYSSVLTGKTSSLLLEPQNDQNASCPASAPGVWLAETPLNDMLSASGASSVGELSPTTLAELTTFIRIRVPSPAVCGPTEVAQGTSVTSVTFTGAGFVSGTTISWDGTQLTVVSETPTAITVNLQPAQMTLGSHTVTVSTDATVYGSIGGTSSFTVVVVPSS